MTLVAEPPPWFVLKGILLRTIGLDRRGVIAKETFNSYEGHSDVYIKSKLRNHRGHARRRKREKRNRSSPRPVNT